MKSYRVDIKGSKETIKCKVQGYSMEEALDKAKELHGLKLKQHGFFQCWHKPCGEVVSISIFASTEEGELEKYLKWSWDLPNFVRLRKTNQREYSFESFCRELGKYFQAELDSGTGNANMFRSETNRI